MRDATRNMIAGKRASHRLAKNNTSGCKGVWRNNINTRWVAFIDGRYLGCFVEYDDAVAARKAAEKQYWSKQHDGDERPEASGGSDGARPALGGTGAGGVAAVVGDDAEGHAGRVVRP